MLLLGLAATLSFTAGNGDPLGGAFVLPSGAEVELPSRPEAGWYRGVLRSSDVPDLSLLVHESGALLNLAGVTFLDAGCDLPAVRTVAQTRLHYPPSALGPALRRLEHESRELRRADLRPTEVSLRSGDPGADPPWLMSHWSYRGGRGHGGVRGRVNGRVELPRGTRLLFVDGRTRTRESDVFLVPVSNERDFERALADSVVLVDELRLGVSPAWLLERMDVVSVYSLSMTNPKVRGSAHVRDGHGVVEAPDGRALSAHGLGALVRWARERSAAGERLAALAPATEPGGPDRAFAVTFEGAPDLWRAKEARLYLLELRGGELRGPACAIRVTRKTRGSGGGLLRWFGTTDEGRTLEVSGLGVDGNGGWTCVLPEHPPRTAVTVQGASYSILAGRALSAAKKTGWNEED